MNRLSMFLVFACLAPLGAQDGESYPAVTPFALMKGYVDKEFSIYTGSFESLKVLDGKLRSELVASQPSVATAIATAKQLDAAWAHRQALEALIQGAKEMLMRTSHQFSPSTYARKFDELNAFITLANHYDQLYVETDRLLRSVEKFFDNHKISFPPELRRSVLLGSLWHPMRVPF